MTEKGMLGERAHHDGQAVGATATVPVSGVDDQGTAASPADTFGGGKAGECHCGTQPDPTIPSTMGARWLWP